MSGLAEATLSQQAYDDLKKSTMENLQQLRSLAEDALKQGEDLLFGARTKETKDGRVAHLYVLSILEQYRAALCLFDHHAGTHAPSLIRCMLEYLVDLINVLNDPAYVDQLKTENAHSDHKVFDAYVKAIYGVELEEPMARELKDLQAEIEAREKAKEQARSRKIENTRQKELPSLYSLLCGLTHPNLTSLMARHAHDDGSLAYCRPPSAAVHRMLLSIAIRLLSIALSQFHRFTDCDPERVTAMVEHINAENLRLQSK
ncbi:DUF5677 domain-containing protein [Uliginosibacterium sp. TH139]|uniref:DUF5677 domain-containing protein n=1 Tax=Uliginosibacterium sp. TH139 TaxID=2067453 RepID=UPI000C7DCF97|nr:DUF5677 domain-containing protein [Uliginosibacterium sp. TH139]PLK47098.1 hypothetical protein C0V76_18760 [Uliginosibacterium sp. TH139]